jgi:hypothetical protein
VRRIAAVVAVVLVVLAGAWIWRANDGAPGAGEPSGSGAGAVEDVHTPALAPGSRRSEGPTPAETPDPARRPVVRLLVMNRADDAAIEGATAFLRDGMRLGVTGADGRLVVEVPARAGEAVSVVVRRSGYAASSATVGLDEEHEIRLAAGTALRGRVVRAPQDEPVGGARVLAFDGDGITTGEPTTTSPDGRFHLDDVGPAGVDVVVQAPGRATLRRHERAQDPGSEIVFRLPEGAVLEGTVFDESGRTLPGIRVIVVTPGRLPPDRGRGDPLDGHAPIHAAAAHRTTTDAAGHYEIAGLPVPSTLQPVAEVTPRHVSPGDSATFQKPGERVRRNLFVVAPGSLSVLVEGISKATADEATVVLNGQPLGISATPADRSGPTTWSFEWISPGAYEVRFLALGSAFSGARTTVESGGRTQVRIRLGGSSTLGGVVVDPAGAPVGEVALWWQGPESSFVRANERGEFRFAGLSDGPGTLIARANSGRKDQPAYARTMVEGVRPGATPLRVVLAPAPVIVGRFEGAASEPHVGVTGYARDTQFDLDSILANEHAGFERNLDVTGTPVLLAFHAAGHAPTLVELPSLAPGQRWELGTIRFGRGRTVDVTVRDPAGKPVAAWVDVVERWAGGQKVWTGESGTARLERVPAWPVTLSVGTSASPRHWVHLPAAASSHSVTVDGGGHLELTVLERDGSPAAGARVSVFPARDFPYGVPAATTVSTTSDDTGKCRTHHSAGSFRVRVRSPAFFGETFAGPFEVRTGETTSAEVRLR